MNFFNIVGSTAGKMFGDMSQLLDQSKKGTKSKFVCFHGAISFGFSLLAWKLKHSIPNFGKKEN